MVCHFWAITPGAGRCVGPVSSARFHGFMPTAHLADLSDLLQLTRPSYPDADSISINFDERRQLLEQILGEETVAPVAEVNAVRENASRRGADPNGWF